MSETSTQPESLKQNPRTSRIPTAWLTLNMIDIEQEFNIREEMGDLEELADSLIHPDDPSTIKVLEMFTVRKLASTERTYYVLENGHRRYAALRILEKRGLKVPAVQCIVQEGMAPNAERVYQQLIRNNGKDLTTIEKANAVAALIEEGQTEESIQKRWGVSPVFMTDLRKLYTAPKFVRMMITDGRLTSYLAIEFMTRFPDQDFLLKRLTEADTAAKSAAEAKGVTKYKIMPRHSPALMALRPQSKGRKGAKGGDEQMEFIPTVESMRKNFAPLAAKGAKLSAEVSTKMQTVSLVLDALEGKLSFESLYKKLGITKAALAKIEAAKRKSAA